MNKLTETHHTANPAGLNQNFIQSIGDDWMLITAGKEAKFNTMTASWGTLGVLWNLPVAICFVRPTRYTYHFMEASDYYTLSFFEERHKKILRFCGARSGKDTDKIKSTGLIPALTTNNAIGYAQSSLILECRKIYYDDLKPGHFLLPEIDERFYPEKDYHRIYIGEITHTYLAK